MPARIRSIEALRRELRATEQKLAKLSAQRGKAVKALDAIDRKIAILTGQVAPTTAKKKRKKAAKAVVARKVGKVAKVRKVHKPVKGARLVDYISKVLAGSAGMRAKNIQAAVAKAGYQSVSKDFYNIVAATLRDKKLFRRVKRGVYKLVK